MRQGRVYSRDGAASGTLNAWGNLGRLVFASGTHRSTSSRQGSCQATYEKQAMAKEEERLKAENEMFEILLVCALAAWIEQTER